MAECWPTIETYRGFGGYLGCFRRWAPPGEPIGRIVMLHGIQSHGGWYLHSCRRLASSGFEVLFVDRRGSGMNRTARGDAVRWRHLIRDLELLLDHAEREDRRRPVILTGISWGAKVVVAFAHQHRRRVDALAFIGPGFCPRVRPPLLTRLQILLSRLVAPRRHFPIPLNDPELFTATPEKIEYIRRDPLTIQTGTARFLIASFLLDRLIRRMPRQIQLPALLQLAARDRIIDNPATRRYFAQFPSPHKEVIEYEGAYHTLEFEPDPDPMIDDFRDWAIEIVQRQR